MKLHTEDDVLQAVTRRRKTAPDAGMWAWLIEKNYINEVLIGEQTVDKLITTIREFESYGWTKQTRRDNGEAPQMLDARTHEPLGSGVRPHDRIIAISTLLPYQRNIDDRIEVAQLDAGILGGEVPVDGDVGSVAVPLPGSYF